MTAVTCPHCQHAHFQIHVTAYGVDLDVDVTGEDKFLVDRTSIDQPDAIEIEAICGECGHARYVPADQWEWA